MQELEAKISELESEIDRLSTVLEAQKAATSEAHSTAAKKVEELSRGLQKKASSTICIAFMCNAIRPTSLYRREK